MKDSAIKTIMIGLYICMNRKWLLDFNINVRIIACFDNPISNYIKSLWFMCTEVWMRGRFIHLSPSVLQLHSWTGHLLGNHSTGAFSSSFTSESELCVLRPGLYDKHHCDMINDHFIGQEKILYGYYKQVSTTFVNYVANH